MTLLALCVLPCGGGASAALHQSPRKGVWGANGPVWAVKQVGDTVYLGGQFTSLVGPKGEHRARANLAAIDVDTGEPTRWAPSANGQVFALAWDGSAIIAGGGFTSVNGTARDHYAEIGTDGTLRSHDVHVSGTVSALAVRGSTVYLGGAFSAIDSRVRRHLGAVTLKSSLLGWRANTNGRVAGLVAAGSDVVAVGDFTTVDGAAHRYLVKLGRKTATIRPWASAPNYKMLAVTAHKGTIYGAQGGPGGHVLAWNQQSGHQLWSTYADGDAQAIDFDRTDNRVIAGGHFIVIGGKEAARLAALMPASGAVDGSWAPHPDVGGVWALDARPDEISVGGNKFTAVGGVPADRFALFRL